VCFLRLMKEDRNVASGGKGHLDRVVSALPLVERRQALAKPVSLDPGDRVLSCPEGCRGAAENFRGDVVFVQLLDIASGEFRAHVPEQMRQPRRPSQRFHDAVQFAALRIGELGTSFPGHRHSSRRDFFHVTSIASL